MIFQTLDDKNQCFGVYVDGALYFDPPAHKLTKPWNYSGSLSDKEIDYGFLYAGGLSLDEVCPNHLKDEWQKVRKKFYS